MIGFAFCHGWSFDAQMLTAFQASLAQHFPHAPQACFDLGFRHAAQSPRLAPEVRWIAIGHSYGFAWLLQQSQPWQAAISINGFTRFCRRPGQPHGTPTRLVDAMLARLAEDAPAVVKEFQARCGMSAPRPADYDQPMLLHHLIGLRDLDLSLPACPVLALATGDDPIVSPALARACFGQAGSTLQELPGDHTYLLREPAAAAAAIAEFAEKHHG